MNTDDIVYGAGNALVYMGAVIQPEVLFRWIQLGLGILMTLVGLAYRVWCWYKKAKADGKITGDEIKELIEDNKDEVSKVIDDVTEIVEEIKENKNS